MDRRKFIKRMGGAAVVATVVPGAIVSAATAPHYVSPHKFIAGVDPIDGGRIIVLKARRKGMRVFHELMVNTSHNLTSDEVYNIYKDTENILIDDLDRQEK